MASAPRAHRNVSRYFQQGDKLYVLQIDENVKKEQVSFKVVACDSCNGTDPPSFYKSEVVFQFSGGYLETAQPGPVLQTVSQVFSLDKGDAQPQGAPANAPAAAPAVTAPPAPIAPPPPPADQPPPNIEVGQTVDQVVASLGQPQRIAKVGAKQIYFYKDLKVTFTNGKVSDVEVTEVSALQYSLPPDQLQRAIEYAHAGYRLHFGSELLSMAILAAIIVTGLRRQVSRLGRSRIQAPFVQALVFIPLLLLTNDALYLPANIYGQHLELKFDQSIQTWPSWFWDWTKTELLLLVCAVPIAFLLYAVIRRSPRRWWFYFWLATLPIIVTVMYLEPMVIEPMFYRFEPLTNSIRRSWINSKDWWRARGLTIPPDRMFEMKASEKLNSLNAYVSGFGASKRVVVWDTTLAEADYRPKHYSYSATRWGITF